MTVVLDDREMAELEAAARGAGLPRDQWARDAVLEALAHRLIAGGVAPWQPHEPLLPPHVHTEPGGWCSECPDLAQRIAALAVEPERVPPAPTPPPPLRARTVPVRPMGERCLGCGASASYRVRPSSGKLEACCAPCRAWL